MFILVSCDIILGSRDLIFNGLSQRDIDNIIIRTHNKIFRESEYP